MMRVVVIDLLEHAQIEAELEGEPVWSQGQKAILDPAAGRRLMEFLQDGHQDKLFTLITSEGLVLEGCSLDDVGERGVVIDFLRPRRP